MTPLGIFRKKEKEEKKEEAQPTQKTLLEELCGDDMELYEALSRTIMLNPEITVKEGVDSHVGKAQEHEKAGNHVRARIAYQVAGEISLYEGKLAQMQKFFEKASEVDPNYANRNVFEYFGKKENAERALTVAKEFYTKIGKLAEKKEGSSD